MGDEQWLKEDGYLNVDTDSTHIIYHPHLNVILVFTKAGDVKVIDVNSGVILQSCPLADDGSKISGRYLPRQDKILLWNERNIGLRGDYNGVMLLDTILQTPVKQSDDIVKIELLYSEAVLFLQCIQNLEENGLENTADVSNELMKKIMEAQLHAKKGIKAQKWNIICLELPHSSLKMVANNVLYQLKRLDRHIPALAIASAVNERLTDLLIGSRLLDSLTGGNAQRCLMFSEAARRQTFEQWPHMDYKWALPDQMAQAGFYHQPGESGDDRAMCFTCSVCLVCWEKTDEPWSEHERHSPTCPFVKGEYTQNVPLSVTYATSPAIATNGFSIVSRGDDRNIMCTGDVSGELSVWNIERNLKKILTFRMSTDESLIKSHSAYVLQKFSKITTELNAIGTFYATDQCGSSVACGSMMIDDNSTKKLPLGGRHKVIGTKICCGVVARGTEISGNDAKCTEMAMNIENQAKSSEYGIEIPSNCMELDENDEDDEELFLVLYDILDSSREKPHEKLPPPPEEPIILDSMQSDQNEGATKKSSLKSIELPERSDGDSVKMYTDLSTGDDLDNIPENKNKIDPMEEEFLLEPSIFPDKFKVKSTGNGTIDFGASPPAKNPIKIPPKSHKDEINCVPVQCISLKSLASDSYRISDIIPSHDEKYLLVVLRQQMSRDSPKETLIENEPVDEKMEIAEEDLPKSSSAGKTQNFCEVENMTQLILFKIQEDGLLNETPHCVRHLFEDATPLEICMLPGYETDRKTNSQETKDGVFVMTCMDGTLRLLALSTLRTISEASIDGVKFISATYCKSLERMCGCTEKGSLHFYSFYDMEADSGDEHDEHNTTFIVSDSSLSDVSVVSDISGVTHAKKTTSSDSNTLPSTSTGYSASHPPSDSGTNLIAHKSELTVNDLKLAYALTEFDEMLTPYTAEVPVCWSELVQAQKVRRHPQHLKPGDDTHLTRTWRLHNDATTWDEHLIELCLPKQSSLGHIDFKFNLYQQCSNPPAIQITLLKQFSSGFGYRMKAPPANVGNAPVDENIEFNLNSSENPVLSVEYLQSHNAEILAGPIELSSCMDLSEQSGTVILTSPKLFRTKGRNYLIHIKTMNDPSKDSQGKTRGCDWLHEISITVRSTNPMCRMVNERSQRSGMLESNGFLMNLLKMGCDSSQPMTQNISLDIIMWIVSVRMARYRAPRNTESTFPDVHSLQKDCIRIMEMHLGEFIKNCILYGNRSVAHKCVKIVLVTLEGAHNMKHKKTPNSSFEEALKNGILECFPHITNIKYAGSLRWFTLMICGTSNTESYNSIASECLRLMLNVAKEMSNRFNAYTSLLRSRFGLYGMPFELELFDADLPTSAKYAALPTTFANIIKSATSQNASQGMDLKNFFTSDGSELKMLPFHMRKRGIGNQLKGLLEVEPLHYTCIAASEATRLENMDSMSAAQATFETPTVNNVDQMPNDTAGKSKEANGAKQENGIDESLMTVKNNFVDKIFYSALKKHKNKEQTQKMYADVVMAASASGGQSKEQNLTSVKNMKRLVKILKIDMGTDLGGMDVEVDAEYLDGRSKVKTLNEKMQQYMDETEEGNGSSMLPWHKLLSLPPKQMIVIDRMHSGARRYVVLDFGMPIMLTDLVIPACEDLVSLFIDIWCFEEESDSIRLAVSSDIGSKTLVLSDLQPPPVFRYMKITITGRYGMSATRCKIPIGTFFGHAVVMEVDSYADPLCKYLKTKTSNLPAQLKVLHSLFEDVHCRYSLASSKLMELLDPLLSSDSSNMSHMQAYLYRVKECDDSLADHTKIINIYDDCISFQHQLNVIRNVIARLEGALEENPIHPKDAPRMTMSEVCTDKLRVLQECLIEALLHFVIEFGTLNANAMAVAFNQNACEIIFNNIVIASDTHMQLATCSFLVKMCCFEPWWGDFIANIFTVWYSSQNSKIFPQDRVFFLLTYLGRKSITMGSCRVTVIDAILKTLAKFLAPLSNNYRMEYAADEEHDERNDFCHWASTDLQLIGWLLLFLSVCLDDCGEKKDQSSARWDFMSSEVDMSRAKNQGSGNTRLFTRSFKKRFYQNKIPSSSYNTDSQFAICPNAFLMQGQAMQSFDALQKQSDTLKDFFLKKSISGKSFPAYLIDGSSKVKFKMSKATTTASSSAPTTSATTSNQGSTTPIGSSTPLPPIVPKDNLIDTNESPFERALRAIKPQNTIIVIRGLIGLILGMDFTCNMDLFLLACKIIARLVSSCRSTIQLSKIITPAQLQQLIRIAVWEDQQQPWAIHAITCLLQDILETDRNFKCDLDDGFNSVQPMELSNTDAAASMDDSLDYVVDNDVMQCVLEKITTLQNSTVAKDAPYADALKTKLPSLMECEDAEMEDLLDDIFDNAKSVTYKKDNTTQSRTVFTVNYRSFFSRTVSCVMDARLEYGLESNIEIALRRLSMATSLNLFANWPPVVPDGEIYEATVDLPPWPEHIVQAWSCAEYTQGYPTHVMLILVFDNIFSDFHESWLNLEQVLQMWLTLNGELGDKTPTGNFMPMESPRIPFGRNAIQGLLSALSWHPNIKLRAWCLGFQCLALACNTSNFDWLNAEYNATEDLNQNHYTRMGPFIVNNQNFEKMLLRFFSGTDMCSSVFDVSRCSGPTACKLLHELFKRLEVQTEKCNTKKKLKETLLRVLQSLIQPNGAIANQQGPIDAQNQLIKELISYQYEKTDLGIAMSIIESVSFLVYNNISNAEKMYCQKSTDNNKNYNAFSNLFNTVLCPENTSKTKTVSDNSLLVNLLKLSTILVQTALPREGEDASTSGENLSESFESQTDEIKAEQQNSEQQQPARPKVACVADTVLQHYPTMTRLLGSLSHCSSSSFALLAASAMYSSSSALDTNSAFGEPQTVADAVFQLLMLLSKKASQPVLVVRPIYLFLNTTFRQALPKLHLSEPFLWFILRVLDSVATVSIFTEMGGIKVLCHSLVRSNRTMINMQPGLVSMIMQHLTPNIPTVTSTSSNANGTKKSSQASVKTIDGLINFAPFCSISSDISTAQQADVLIQIPTPSHRRARTAAWNYMFYPNESYVDLTINFPTAVLLYEIQLQPHLLSLASCPYAVAVEITRDNSMPPIPISQPMPTVGLTCIRLKLNQPEIATSIVLRLYRPRDSSNIGLTQIAIYGTTTFNDINKVADHLMDEENQAKSSLGWLRVLARCFSVATFKTEGNIANAVISAAASYPDFLEACCSLLNVAPQTSTIALQNLETVLLKLGLFNRELGLKLINILLKNTVPQCLKLCNDSVSDLLYDLCTHQDDFTRDRVEAMVNWVQTLYDSIYENLIHPTNPYSGFIKCLASILWTVHTKQLAQNLEVLITKELFQSIYKWTLILDTGEPLKKAFDAMLCSICCIRPEMFPFLLRRMNVLVPNLSTGLEACISDDRKDTGMTDDTKQEESDTAEWYSHLVIEDISELNLTKSQLSTVALACQSTVAIHQLLDSGLPRLLTSVILEFCHKISSLSIASQNAQEASSSCLTDSAKVEGAKMDSRTKRYPMVNVSTCADILNFFSEVCTEGSMRDWLGSYEGSVFWKPLLDILCNISPLNSEGHIETNFSYLEDSMIKFLSKVTACHPKNQDALTVILISVIKKPTGGKCLKQSISGFTRRLVLQLLLESERILVSVHSDMSLHRRETGNVLISSHPSRRPNAHNLLFLMSTHTRCQEILESCITVFSNMLPNSQCGDAPAPPKPPEREQQASTSGASHMVVTANGTAASITSSTQSSSSNGKYSCTNDLFEMALGQGLEVLSVAAGVTAKDKRLKDVKNQAAAMKAKELLPLLRLRNDDNISTSQMSNCAQLMHPACPGVILTSDTTVSQILAMLHSSGMSLSTPCISLTLVQGRKQPDDISDDTLIKASDFEPLPSPLQIFSSHGGLSLLAHYLPTVYPDSPKSNGVHSEKDKSPPASEWVKVEANDDIYEDLDDGMAEQGSKLPAISSVPQHSLSAFGLFLRLPPYSDVLLRDKTRAQCLLRLVLGVTGDGEGNEIYSLSLASTLPTLPFEVFRQLLDSSPLTTDDGVILRRMVIEVGAINFVLNCLSIFTHHQQQSEKETPITTIFATVPDAQSMTCHPKAPTPTGNALGVDESMTSDDKSHVYWAKGTGFGTGSTQQSWDVEQALLRQKNEEEHVTVLLQVLSSYINPGDKIPAGVGDEASYHEVTDITSELPPIFNDLLQQSCLIPALCSYLRNDSVLDITRHIPLYRAILQLLRAIALSNQLVSLLQPQQSDNENTSISALLSNMKSCVDTYASRLKFNKKSGAKGRVFVSCVDEGDDEGLALLIPDIQDTTFLVLRATNADKMPISADESQDIDRPISRSIEQRYMEIMKKLQFDTFEMITETENGYRFVVSYHFESNMRMSGDRYHPIRVKRLAQETVTLSTSLPLSYSSSVFVRCDSDRLDVMKVLITGPADTPYANGCFEFDVFFPPDYPNSPMMINLETTGRHTVRFNPNLYNDGKVCLSVLNTWHGRPEEKWNAQTSSFLQVLVSIQSLILVPEPYFNEPGFERSRGTPSGTHSSREYNSNIYQACVRWAMLEQIKNPNPCFKEVIHTHFWLKRNEICTQIEKWIEELSKPQYSERNGRNISFNSMVLRRQYRHLREELANLPTPEGLEDLERPFNASVPSPKASESGGTSGGSAGGSGTGSGCATSSASPTHAPPPSLQAMETAMSSDTTSLSDLMDEDENPGLG